MKRAFRARLANGPAGDPLLVVRSVWGGRVLLFDMGRSEGVSNGTLLKATDLFVSHTHLDHWIGFDHLMRLHIHRPSHVRLHGGPGLAASVAGKFAAYSWNLVAGDETVFEVRELGEAAIRVTLFRADSRFAPEEGEGLPRKGDAALSEEGFRVRAVALDHGIPSLAWALEETLRVNVRPEALEARGLRAGEWLRGLKARVRLGAPDGEAVDAPRAGGGTETLTVGEARRDFLLEGEGERLVYATDLAGTEENAARLVPLARGADDLYLEAPFLERDRGIAEERKHLTARLAGEIARRAGVKRLHPFHFSRRYQGEFGEHLLEAEAAFGGEVVVAP